MHRFQSSEKQFPKPNHYSTFLFSSYLETPIKYLSIRFLSSPPIQLQCVLLRDPSDQRHARASAANEKAISSWISVLKTSTFPEAFLNTTPETDFAQESSKAASKLILIVKPSGGHQPTYSSLMAFSEDMVNVFSSCTTSGTDYHREQSLAPKINKMGNKIPRNFPN
ncbi:putative protein isoform X1 [Gossypium australe]|uniref:Uncharacterized protein n=1 Tax=Gossypium australe TaxID=47621 RepID=A0A5B6VTE3_9ROSI|nr:putative protein isoform X1 [Gossypium australe]